MDERGTSRSAQAAGSDRHALNRELADLWSSPKGEWATLGALPHDDGVTFRVWAPQRSQVELVLTAAGTGEPTFLPMERRSPGLHELFVAGASAGDAYRFRIDGNDFPDPASRSQPEGVHGTSVVVDPRTYRWRHEAPAGELTVGSAIYELHIGAFTPAGTFSSARDQLPYIADLGVDTVELMPVHGFPGRWNWGYDPGSHFAPADGYGDPDDLRAFVDDAHGLGMRVLLDVVYNHFGPDGAYFPAFVPDALTERHHTPWGQAIDFDGPTAAGLRRFFLENALMWLDEYRCDGLRLDATFAIVDDSASHWLAELSEAVAALPGPSRLLIAEDPRNLRNLVLPVSRGGLGLHGVWADDLHHQLRVRLAGDDRSYFADFDGSARAIARTLEGNWFYTGQHSRNAGKPRGTPAFDLPPRSFVTCIQNHDQVGNRVAGERLGHQVERHALHAAAALLLFAPQLPLLFMGQEWGASTPFQYFTDHAGELGRMVSEGRKQEFSAFDFASDPPDPQDPGTFTRSKLDWSEVEREEHAGTLALYRDLLVLRRTLAEEFSASHVRDEGLVLERGGLTMLVALAPGARLPVPNGSHEEWRSESSRYLVDPKPAKRDGDELLFEREGVVLVRL